MKTERSPPEEKVRPHRVEATALLAQLRTDPAQGLTSDEAARRLCEYGPNEIVERDAKSVGALLWAQLSSVMPLMLLFCGAVSAALGDRGDALAIIAIVVLNTLLGFVQEYRAERAIQALRRLAAPLARVRREGAVHDIPARTLVPGDLLLLEAGHVVPADARLIESAALRTEEAALTGESDPVEKETATLPEPDLPLGDQRNMVFKGTLVAAGRGVAVVAATGMDTQLGRIAEMIQSVAREATPLQRRLAQLARGLAAVALGLVAVIFVLGLLRGEPLELMFLTAMSAAVAAVPEGLPAVVTIALALGAQRMLRRRALIRQLPAVETLGSTTVICSDKTGTLTENRMTVTVLDLAGDRIELAEVRRDAGPEASAEAIASSAVPHDSPALALLRAGFALCNDARLAPEPPLRALGDPTEAALLVAAARLGAAPDALNAAFPRLAEEPFDSTRKRMTTLHALPEGPSPLPPLPGRYLAFTKGGLDELLGATAQVWTRSGPEPLTDDWRRRIAAAHDAMAGRGMRVLGLAFRSFETLPAAGSAEAELVFLGLAGMHDPPRPEAKAAVQTCRDAGIRPVLLTGDHPLTAQQVARALGFRQTRLLTGRDLDRLSDAELAAAVDAVDLFARVAPEHKIRIVQALQRRGHIVSMTGDGVNDAPALRKADIGVAMGVVGTDVSKEAADIVLLDDNFATIVAAVEEGRILYDNIRKFIQYALTGNVGEIAVMLLAPFLGMPLALTPLQILWINLVTDGLPGLALGLEIPERDTMRRPPYPPGENVFGRGLGWHIVRVGATMGLAPLLVGWLYWRTGSPAWQTVVFTTLTLAQMGHALAIRSRRDSLFTIGLFTNRALLAAVALTVALQMAVVYAPPLQTLFHTVALAPADLAIALLASAAVFWQVELEKWLLRRRSPRPLPDGG